MSPTEQEQRRKYLLQLILVIHALFHPYVIYLQYRTEGGENSKKHNNFCSFYVIVQELIMSDIQREKILFLITKSNWGGAQRYVYDLAVTLDKEQFEPIVVLGGDGVLKNMLEHAHIRTISIKTLQRDVSIKKEFAFANELRKIIKEEKPSVLHVNSSKAGGVGALIGRLTGVPRIIFTAHGWAFNEQDQPGKN